MKFVFVVLMSLSFTFVNAQEGSAQATGAATKEEKKAMHEQLKDERDAVNVACVEEAKVANCGDKVVGKGLLKCIHAHKKASADFKISDGCKTAMKSLRSERKNIKGKK